MINKSLKGTNLIVVLYGYYPFKLTLMIELKRICKNCNEPLEGRTDKKFCSEYCKSSFHYEKDKEKEQSMYKKIDKHLKLNRRILKEYNRAGKSTVRKAVLMELGFKPEFFTHYWKNKEGQVYLFCYEYGFLSIQEKNKSKYLLVHWQSYMGNI